MAGLFLGKSQSKMDDDWGYADFRKAPYCPKSVMVIIVFFAFPSPCRWFFLGDAQQELLFQASEPPLGLSWNLGVAQNGHFLSTEYDDETCDFKISCWLSQQTGTNCHHDPHRIQCSVVIHPTFYIPCPIYSHILLTSQTSQFHWNLHGSIPTYSC